VIIESQGEQESSKSRFSCYHLFYTLIHVGRHFLCQLCHSLSFANLSVDKIFCGANMLADLLADNKATANGERYTCMFSNLDLN